MAIREDFITAIDSLVGGTLPLEREAKLLAIDRAMEEHSRNKPRIIVEKESGADAFDYAVTGLDYWSDGFSVVKKIEYPVDDDDQEANYLDDDEWEIFSKETGDVIRFLDNTPTSSEYFRVHYTALHTCGDTTCTIADGDVNAVKLLVAAVFCDMLAVYYAQNMDSSISSDSVQHSSQAREYAARAKAYRGMYYDQMGIKPGSVKAASITVDQDRKPSWQSKWLTHSQKYR